MEPALSIAGGEMPNRNSLDSDSVTVESRISPLMTPLVWRDLYWDIELEA
jgi:hypothetical protein